MPYEQWSQVTIGSVCNGIFDGPHATPTKTTDGPVFLGIWNLVNGRVDLTSTEHLSEVDFVKWTRRITPEAGDLVFSYETKLGSGALIPEGLRCCLGRRMALARPNRRIVDPRFLLYYFLSPPFQETIRSRAIPGSTVERIALLEFPRFEIKLPSLDEQRRITALLGALDDKIELNRRTNETLEAMARSLFKSWFVDFDPVTAKAAGKKPFGMTDDLAALFPSKFVDSDQGPIPKGWRYRPVGEVIESVFDGPHATPPDSDQGAVFLGIKNMTGTGLDFSEIRHISEADWPKWTRRVTPRHGDIVFTYEATLGFFALIPPGLRCCLGRRMALVRPSDGTAHPHFLFHWFVSEPFQETIERGATHGSTVNRVPLLDFPKYPVIWPTIPLVEKFEHRASSIWASIHQRQEESRQLIALRDSLLPKLLSGEIRLRDAERKIKEVV